MTACSSGFGCEDNPSFMLTQCPSSCNACHIQDNDRRCDFLGEYPPALQARRITAKYSQTTMTANNGEGLLLLNALYGGTHVRALYYRRLCDPTLKKPTFILLYCTLRTAILHTAAHVLLLTAAGQHQTHVRASCRLGGEANIT